MIQYVSHYERLSAMNASKVFARYNIILDCTDNPASRYLISDTAVLMGKRLVSASALGTEGQLMVLNDPPLSPGDSLGGPCYRCIFPKPPSAASVVSCDEGGILGPVVGIMGVYQSLEAIKLVLASCEDQPSNGRLTSAKLEQPTMLLFSAFSKPAFRAVRLRPRRKGCVACSADAKITLDSLLAGSLGYAELCGSRRPLKLLDDDARISASDYSTLRNAEKRHILVDVREKVHFDISHLEGSISFPFSDVQSGNTTLKDLSEDIGPARDVSDYQSSPTSSLTPIFVLCRLGNDSQLVVRKMIEAGWDAKGVQIKDIRGGLKAWQSQVDPSWPFL